MVFAGVAGSWGRDFYSSRPPSGMPPPPLNWGYPRTVTGFFHAFTRGQYERIHPTTNFIVFCKQVVMYIAGALEEFNGVYLLLGLIPFFFYKRMQPRERAWIVGLGAIYFCLSIFLLILLNPAADRQSRDLNKPFFIASHVLISIGIVYGLTLIGSLLATQYAKWRQWALYGGGTTGAAAPFSGAGGGCFTPQTPL